MSNPNNNLQTQTSNALHNAIMESGGKDRPPILAPGNYVQWKSRIKRYIDTKPNNELIHYCLQNPPYKFKWTEKTVSVTEGSSETTTKGFMETYKTISDDVRKQLDAEAKAVLARFVTLVKQSQELKTVSYHKLYDILKQHQNEANELRAERLAPATRNRGKAIVNYPTPTYAQEPVMVAEDDEMSKEKEIDKLMDLISLAFNKIYKPTNNNLRTSSNTSRTNQDNSPRINRGTGYDNQRVVNVARARETVGTQVVHQSRIQCYNCKEYGHVAMECQKPKRAKDAAYHKEKMLLCKQEEAGFQLNANQADWRDDIDEEAKDHELEAHYMYMARIEEVSPNVAENSGPVDHDDDDLARERDLLASLIAKLKCEINDSKNRNKFLESSNKTLVDKLKREIEDFKTINKSLESSNNHFKEANTELAKTNQLMFKDIKKFQDELDRYHDVNYASKVELDCAKAKGELISYKMSSEKSFNEYTRKINDLNQTISDMKQELVAHQESISIMSQEKEAHKKFYKTREDKELEKVTALENKIKVLDDIVYKTGQSVQTMNMLNRNCKTSFVKPEFLKKAQRENPRLYDKGFYNDNLALMLAPESDESIHLAQESQSKLSDLIKPFDYKQLNSLYYLFIPEREKSAEQRSFSKKSKLNLKAQLQDKNIAISELKKLTEKLKGKSVETKFEKSLVIRQPNAFKSQRQSILGKPTPFSDSLAKKDFSKSNSLIEIILFIVDSGCSKHMTGSLKLLTNFVEKFLGTVKFGNDQIAVILGYGDLVQGNITIKRVYYVQGLNHNLFSVGQFCDADLEVSFRKSTCYVRDLKGNDLLTTSSSQAWLWHSRLSHLNFDTINLLSKNDIVNGLPKLKFIKDHLCSSCELGKAKRKSFKTKTTPSSKRRLQILHMDLCGPMRVESFNGKKYVLVIVDDYSRFTWTHFLRSKDETPQVLIDFLKLVQRGLYALVRTVRTNKGT
ncbi:retrovirus-related pol polyprotein from transposon TNT 1-94 [Tanacetum coccineum]